MNQLRLFLTSSDFEALIRPQLASLLPCSVQMVTASMSVSSRAKGACFVTALQCPWLQRRSFVPSTHCVLYIPLHMSTDLQVPMVHDASKLLYLPFPSQKRGVTPTPILSPKERDLGECINISRSLSTLENDKNKNIPCQSGDPLLLMRTLKALKTTKIDQNSL